MKTNKLQVASASENSARAEKSALEHVDVAALEGEVIAKESLDCDVASFLKLVGRQEVLDAIGSITTAMWAENIHKLKKSKGYKKLGLTWEQACCQFFPHLSIDTCDRWAKSFEEFGARFFHVREVVAITAQAYRQLNPGFTEDGKILIAGEEYSLNKSNAAQIQSAIEAQRQVIAEKSDQASKAKAAATKAKAEADGLKKGLENARDEIQRLKTVQDDLYKMANEREKRLLRAQAFLCHAADLMEGVKNDPTTTEMDRRKLRGLGHYGMQVVIEASGDDPIDGLMRDMLEPRDLINEYVEENRATRQ